MLMDLITKFTTVKSFREIYQWSLECCKVLEVDYFLYVVSLPDDSNRFHSYVICNFFDGRLSEPGDFPILSNPILKHCLGSMTPVVWSSHLDVELPIDNGKYAVEGKHRFVLSDGISICVNGHNGGKAVFSFAIRNGSILDRDVRAISYILHIIPSYVYERMCSLYGKRKQNPPDLSKREVECMSWLIQGKTSWEISRILTISERTVEFHISNIVEKLGCTNRQHAIAKAIIQGVLMRAPQMLFENLEYVGTNGGGEFGRQLLTL